MWGELTFLVVSFNFLLLYSWVGFDLEVNCKQVRCAWCDINVVLFSKGFFICQNMQPVDRLTSLFFLARCLQSMLMVWVIVNDAVTWCATPNLLLRLIQTFCLFLFHVCLCAYSRSLEISFKAGCCLCGRTALSAWVLFLLPFSHISSLEAVLKEFHFLGLHLLPPGLFEMLEKELFCLFIC